MSEEAFPALRPAQCCFVVDDVAQAVDECRTRFGWGPFQQFSAPVADARYRDWTGPKRTDVALGMAGRVQVELIHVCEGRDTVAAYQSRYGTGFQHLGIYCRDRERAITALASCGARLDDRGEYTGIRFAFLDVPSGPGMFELLQPTASQAPPGEVAKLDTPSSREAIALDRATIATPKFDETFRFFSTAFRWDGVVARTRTLRYGSSETRLRRARGRAGALELELIEAQPAGSDPYSQHAARGDHGLVHAGGRAPDDAAREDAALECTWLEENETFRLYDWSGGPKALQLRD